MKKNTEVKLELSDIARILRSSASTQEERSRAAAALGARGGSRSHSGEGRKSRSSNKTDARRAAAG